MIKEVEVLKKGGLILYPTDTIWGLGCDALNYQAIEKINSLKGRSQEKHFLILVSDIEMLRNYVEEIPQKALDLMNSIKEPLTIIYPKAKSLPAILVSDDNTIGIRIPNHDYCQKILKTLNRPIISTSANKTGEPSPQSYKDINQEIKDGVDFISEYERENEKENSIASYIYKINFNEEIIKLR